VPHRRAHLRHDKKHPGGKDHHGYGRGHDRH
jgi:hypothetical protein